MRRALLASSTVPLASLGFGTEMPGVATAAELGMIGR